MEGSAVAPGLLSWRPRRASRREKRPAESSRRRVAGRSRRLGEGGLLQTRITTGNIVGQSVCVRRKEENKGREKAAGPEREERTLWRDAKWKTEKGLACDACGSRTFPL